MKDRIRKILRESDELNWASDAISDENLPFDIGNPIVKPDVRNTFRIHVNFMSGDGDHYEDFKYDFKTKEMERFLGFLKFYQSLHNGYWRDEGHIQKLMETLGLCGRGDDCWDWMWEYVPKDVTGGDDYYPAAVRGLEVTFFDDSGVEREVKLKKPTGLYTPKDFGSRW